MGPYQRRIVDDELDELFPQLPAILLDGPKGVGKTSTAEQRCVTVRRLDVEVKLAAAVDDTDVRHLVWLRDKLGDECIDTLVLHTGPEAYRRTDGVAVVPLALLGP